MVTLSDRVAHLRAVAGIKARELDRLAGLAEGHSRSIEIGQRPRIEAETALQLARTLGASLDWLIAGLGEPPMKEAVDAAIDAARKRYEEQAQAAASANAEPEANGSEGPLSESDE